ncbi:MAG TPA: nucleoside transporter C-terminal domain-containing protein [Bryobacteraceae bacterium]|jgi:CNT family concentrative nucleoside transporter|nr:nucleoside transporter C-terminal domain-containing protein [Bryobacteraceae bacterium]
MGRFTGLLGLVVILGVAYLLSNRRHSIRLRILAWGLGLQFLFAVLVLRTDFGKLFQAIGKGVNAMLEFAEVGSDFLFGPLGVKSGPYGVIFAFQVLPIVIFIASFFSILYYLGVMQFIVRWMAVGMQKTMGASGAESLNVAASIFMGQTEAPLTIKPFIAGMTQSELFTIMASGMAHVSGAVMAAYVKVAGVEIQHLLTAVIMTAPATIMLAKIVMPEVEKPVTAGRVEIKIEKTAVNVIDAAAQGAGDGLHLALNIGAMLIAFLALIAMVNGILGWIHTLPALGWIPVSLQKIFGALFAPVAWLMGVSWKDSAAIGQLLGTRLVLNEFVAFLELAPLKAQLDPRSFTIATYALCGFANFSSIAIQIGGIGALAPNRKSDLARLGLKAVAVGSMANYMSACIAGMLV